MGCCNVCARRAGSAGGGQDVVELLKIGNSRKWSVSEAQSESSFHPREPATTTDTEESLALTEEEDFHGRSREVDPQGAVLWGRTQEELTNFLITQPVQGWEGRNIQSLGEIVWSSLVLLRSCHMEEMSERYLVLFSFQLLILSVDHNKKAFVYENQTFIRHMKRWGSWPDCANVPEDTEELMCLGLLPLAGMNVREVQRDGSGMFEITGPMIESRIISCLAPAEFHIWVFSMQHQIKMANAQCPPSPSSNIPFLVPCDEQWKKRELMKHLLCSPILKWEGTPIQHLGRIHYVAMVQVANACMGDFEERLLVLFSENLVFLSVDRERTGIAYEGKLPLHCIQAKEKSALLGRLQFEVTGSLMDPILITCSTAEDYEKCLFHLQKPEQNIETMTLQPPPMVPKKSRCR